MIDDRATAHEPVMAADVVRLIAPRDGGVVVDATFGAGGYTLALLAAARCQVIGIDRDAEMLAKGDALIATSGGRLRLVHGCFGDMEALLADLGIDQVDGIAFDLGVSSMQLDVAERGFSFRYDAPLDMRMDPASGETAADLVNRLGETELADVIYRFGEERASRRIAAAIIAARRASPIHTTAELARIVRAVLPRGDAAIDPATRTFQALRIVVNDELGELDRGLLAAERLLVPGGRLIVVSFHSLEDRLVKSFLRDRAGEAPKPSRHVPIAGVGETAVPPATFRLLFRGVLKPSAEEVDRNPRARSARLRAAERTAAPVRPISPSDQSQRRAA